MTGVTPGADFRIIAQLLNVSSGTVTATINIIGNGTDAASVPVGGLVEGEHYGCSAYLGVVYVIHPGMGVYEAACCTQVTHFLLAGGGCAIPFFNRITLSSTNSSASVARLRLSAALDFTHLGLVVLNRRLCRIFRDCAPSGKHDPRVGISA